MYLSTYIADMKTLIVYLLAGTTAFGQRFIIEPDYGGACCVLRYHNEYEGICNPRIENWNGNRLYLNVDSRLLYYVNEYIEDMHHYMYIDIGEMMKRVYQVDVVNGLTNDSGIELNGITTTTSSKVVISIEADLLYMSEDELKSVIYHEMTHALFPDLEHDLDRCSLFSSMGTGMCTGVSFYDKLRKLVDYCRTSSFIIYCEHKHNLYSLGR